MIGAIIFVTLYLLAAQWCIRIWLKEKCLFRYGRNPYRRECKRCGQWQTNYSFPDYGSRNNWWEEIYPVGNDPKCECKKYIQ